MLATRPEQIHDLFGAAFNRGDLEALMALYEDGATLVPEPGQSARGAGEIREALRAYLALEGRIVLEPRRVVNAGDVAMLVSQWRVEGTAPDGSPVRLEGSTCDVVRRQPDRSWRLVIDNPFGGMA